MRKIYCTGTTRGLGKAIKSRYDYFNSDNFISLNRPQYDLEICVPAFIRYDFDIYINNAYHKFAQVELLYRLFEANKHRNCTIINISSVSADKLHDYENPYAIHKLALDRACLQLQEIDSYCRVVNFKLGRMDTDMVKDKPGPKMSTDLVARQITGIVNLPFGIVPKTLTFDNQFEPKS